MYRKDYIQRMLEEVSRVIGKALGLRKEGRTEEGLRAIRKTYRSFFSMEAELIERLHPDDMLTFFSGKYELKPEQMEALSKVLEGEGALLESINLVEAQDRFSKALVLLRHIDVNDKQNFSVERKQRITALEEKLARMLPADQSQQTDLQ